MGLILLAGCSGESCSGMEAIPGGFKQERRIPRAVQMRLSENGVAAVEASVVSVIDHLFPGGIRMSIPKSCGDPKVCCDLPDGACQVSLDFAPRSGDPKRLDVNPGADGQVGIVVRARAKTTRNVPFSKSIAFYTISCDGSYDSTRTGADSVRVTADLTFPRDDESGTAGARLSNVVLNDFDTDDFSINGGLDCEFAEALLKDRIIDGLRSEVQSSISQAVQSYGELGFSGRADLGDGLVSSISAGETGKLDLYQLADRVVTASGGVSLDIWGGADPSDDFRAACVPEAPAPTPPSGGIPEVSFFDANQFGGADFDVGIALHKFFLDQAGWAAYEAGLLCVSFGTRQAEVLNAGALGLLAPSMSDLIFGSGNAEIVMALRPRTPPTFELGAGTVSGEGEIEEGLITMKMQDLNVDAYVKVDDRFVRIMTLVTDLVLPFGLDVDPDGKVTPVLGDLAAAFTNLRVVNSKLLAESPAELAEKFPTLLAVAVPFVGDHLDTLTLPDLAGLRITPVENGITAIDDLQFVAIVGRLTTASAKPARVDTSARVVAVRVPETEAFRATRLDPERRPVVELELGGVGSDGTDRNLEWQIRVDGGFWSPWSRQRRRALSRQAFWLQGRHVIEARARVAGQPLSADDEPAVVVAAIDSLPPTVGLEDRDGRLTVSGSDTVSQRLYGKLRSRGGAWKQLGPLPATVGLDGIDRATLEVVVTDESGNEGSAAGSDIKTVTRSGGCEIVSRGRSGFGLAAVLFGAMILLALRRRGAIVVLAAAFAPGCTCSGMVTDGGEAGEVRVREMVVGRWNDVAEENGRVVVSAYESKYGDLVLIERGEEGGEIVRPIDGVPEGAPVDPEGPEHRGGVEDAGDDVGGYTQIALSGSLVQVAYHDFTHRALKFAAESPEGWVKSTIDPGDGIAHVGLYASMTHDAAGVPGIAYMAFGVDDGAKGRKSELRWAQASNAAPGSEADWAISVIAETAIQCTGLCAEGEACVAATDTCEPVETGCSGCGDGQACVAGACADVRELPDLPDLPRGLGLFAAAGRLSDGRPVVAFYDRQKTDLMLAVKDADTWPTVLLDGGTGIDRGMFASLAVGPDDTVHVAHQDTGSDQLRYVTWKDGAPGPTELVDDGIREGELHPVGAAPVMFISPEGAPSIAYQDQATTTILLATRAADAWTHEDLLADTTGSGFYSSVAVTASTVYLATYVNDRRFYPPGGLTIHTP